MDARGSPSPRDLGVKPPVGRQLLPYQAVTWVRVEGHLDVTGGHAGITVESYRGHVGVTWELRGIMVVT